MVSAAPAATPGRGFATEIHENHEARFMVGGLGRAGGRHDHAVRDRRSLQAPSGACATERRLPMQWQTPTATDFRFGFEITLYVAAR
jgi:coenzyme PQQ precursor peptide PqqA